jgi:hypothetical protein
MDFATSVASSYVKNTLSTWKEERFKTLRPVGSFFSKDSYSLPKVTTIPKRLLTNLKYYQTNYLVIFFILSLYGALSSPMFLLILIGMTALWYYAIKMRKEPVRLGQYSVPEKVTLAVVILITLLSFYLASAGTVLFWIFSATSIVVLIHALFCTPPEIDEYGFGTVLPTTMPQQQVPTAATYTS